MPKEKEESQKQYCFQLGQLNVDASQDDKKKRTFSGVAYSGDVITDHWYWDRIIFDLDSMQINGRIPALLEHSPKQRAGAINSHTIDRQEGLKVQGDLMSNEFGTQVAQDSDDGFPWQMSVRIEPTSIEEVEKGEVLVNGKVHQAPITVFRGGRIREVSFCALGADDNTSAVAASHSPKQFTKKEDADVTELEQANAKIKELETKNSELETQNKQFAADKREAEIKTLETELKKEFSAEDKVKFSSLDDTSFGFMSAQLRQFSAKTDDKPNTPNPALSNLFSHQATNGDKTQFNAPQSKSLVDLADKY